MHKHEDELTNHRFQWFALLTGLLAASFGLLWEFKSTAKVPMTVICFLGVLVSLSAYQAASLSELAHQEINKRFKALLDALKLEEQSPIRGFCLKDHATANEQQRWWGRAHKRLLPWNLLFPVFAIFWAGLMVCVWCCKCPAPQDGGCKACECLQVELKSSP